VNAIGIALIWCIVQITLLGLLAGGLYFVVRRLRPAAAAPVVLSSLAIVVILSVLALSPWPRWTKSLDSPVCLDVPDVREGEGSGIRGQGSGISNPTVSDSPKPQAPKSHHENDPDPFLTADDQPSSKARETADAKPTAPTPQPSSAQVLWQTLIAELSDSQAAPDGVWRWPAVVAVVLLAVMACGLAWLLLGMRAVRRQRLRSRAVSDVELSELIDVLRAELGCLRTVELRESDDLATAATVGWRRPVILLPADWRSWTPDQKHAVLAHEIVHARSHDFLALLFGQFGLMLHCYHPLLHWLMDRLRLEQELAADAAAADISGGPRQYLSTIAELALQTQDRRLSWPTRTFLPTRTTFLKRIAVLRDSNAHFDRLSPAVRWTVTGGVVLFGVLVSGLRAPAQPSRAMAANPPAATQPRPANQPPATTQPPVAAQPQTATLPSAATQPPTTLPASPQDGGRLRYGYQKGADYLYRVKIAAALPEEDVTHEGSLVYRVMSSADEQFTLKCEGSLHVASRPTAGASRGMMGPRIPGPPGMFGPPRVPGMPRHFGPFADPVRPEESTFDRRGKTVRQGESPSLPFLLGNQVELIVEQLPDEGRTSWTAQRDLGVIERDQSGPFFSPFGRGGTETNRGATERIDYAVLAQDQDSCRISKKYSLKTVAEQGITHIDMSGDGELVFDKRLGLVRSRKMKYQIRVNEKNVVITIPLSLDCCLMSEQEAVELRKQEEERMAKLKADIAAIEEANKPKPLAPDEKAQLLEELQSADEKLIQKAAKRLSKAIPGKETNELSRALCAAYKSKNEWVQADVMAALKVWATPDAERTVIEASRHPSFMVRNHAVVALGRFKTESAAEAAAAQVAHNRREVEIAMKTMGPVAEPAAIALLENSDMWVRATAAKVLGEIGGKKALAALAKESRLHPNEVHEVEAAIAAVGIRLAEDDPAAHADSNAKKNTDAAEEDAKDNKTTTAPMRTWRDASRTHKVRAAFVELNDDKVTLKRADGQIVVVPLKRLSKADQEYVKDRAEAAESGIEEDPFK
jgi:beta-lactamase regulating signal transducer with metallopeptidase domain/HEAT repeat protein